MPRLGTGRAIRGKQGGVIERVCVRRHRAGTLLPALCHTANTCRRGLVAGIRSVICNGFFARPECSTSIEMLCGGCPEKADCIRHFFRVISFWPEAEACPRHCELVRDLLLKLVQEASAGVSSAQGRLTHLFALFYQHRQSQRNDLRFRDLMHGRIRKTAVCSALAHTYQSLWLRWPPELCTRRRFRLFKLKAHAWWVLVGTDGASSRLVDPGNVPMEMPLVREVLWCLPRVNSLCFSAPLFLKGTTLLLRAPLRLRKTYRSQWFH